MWTSYSARQAAHLIGLPESAVRACIRAGLVGQPGDVPAKLSFRDLATLRTVKALIEGGVPPARARRELTAILRQLPDGTSITNLPLEARAGHVVVRGAAATATGPQLELPFELAPPVAPPEGELRELPPRPAPPAPTVARAVSADEWMARALAAEESNPPAAIEAYQRCLKLRPDSTEAWINLGRLYAEAGQAAQARECFATALRLDPADATALYNLGVIAQDGGAEAEAIELYTRALDLDPQLAEAHYNLATLFDQSGDARAAIRHINEYRKLTK